MRLIFHFVNLSRIEGVQFLVNFLFFFIYVDSFLKNLSLLQEGILFAKLGREGRIFSLRTYVPCLFEMK